MFKFEQKECNTVAAHENVHFLVEYFSNLSFMLTKCTSTQYNQMWQKYIYFKTNLVIVRQKIKLNKI